MITSTKNAAVREIQELQKKPGRRRETGLLVIEGPKMARELPPERFVRGYVTEAFLAENGEEILRGLPYETVAPHVMEAMSDTRTPQGILAVVRERWASLEEITGGEEQPLLLLLEHVSDPGNVGTLIRTAEAAGVTGVILTEDCADASAPKVIRSTMGSVFRVPVCRTGGAPETVRFLREKGVRCLGARLAESTVYDREDYRRAVCFLIGNESRGLTKEAQEAADGCVRIPMLGSVESLNAAVAGAVLMFEAARQRRTV